MLVVVAQLANSIFGCGGRGGDVAGVCGHKCAGTGLRFVPVTHLGRETVGKGMLDFYL